MTRLELLEQRSGVVHTAGDAAAAAERARTAPMAITDTDIAILEYFHGPTVAKEAEERRRPVEVKPIPSSTAPSVKWQPGEPGCTLDELIERNKHYPVKFGFLMKWIRATLDPMNGFLRDMNERNKERNARLDRLDIETAHLRTRLMDAEAQIRALEAERMPDVVGVK